MSETKTKCLWASVDGSHETGCGEVFLSLDQMPLAENGFKFCIFCGKMIEESGDDELKQAVGDVFDFVRKQMEEPNDDNLHLYQQRPDGPIKEET